MQTRPAATPTRAAAAAAIIAAIVGAACGADGRSKGDAGHVDVPSAPASSAAPATAGIGDGTGYHYPDGMAVAVTKAERFKISATAAGGAPGQVGVKITVQFTNGTTTGPVDLALATVRLTAGAGGVVAEDVYDSANHIGGNNLGQAAPGANVTAAWGFAVNPGDLATLHVEVNPNPLQYRGVLFTGGIAG